MEGKIIVDGLLASCYADSNHDLAHITMKTMQWFSEIMEWIFGEDTRFSTFVYMVRELATLILPYGQLFS